MGDKEMTFNDQPTMHLGCCIYSFDNWEDAERACDEFVDYAIHHEYDAFESWLRFLNINFTVISKQCGEKA